MALAAVFLGGGMGLVGPQESRPGEPLHLVDRARSPSLSARSSLIAAGGEGGRLPALLGEAVNSGGLLRPPVPFDPGWMPILVLRLRGTGLRRDLGRHRLGTPESGHRRAPADPRPHRHHSARLRRVHRRAVRLRAAACRPRRAVRRRRGQGVGARPRVRAQAGRSCRRRRHCRGRGPGRACPTPPFSSPPPSTTPPSRRRSRSPSRCPPSSTGCSSR